MDALISVIIVNYNAGPYLARCLASLAAQTRQDFEVIIIDNASHDDSLGAARALVEPRSSNGVETQIVCNATNLGFAAAQNQGMRLAKGEFILALNFDIHLLPNFLDTLVAALQHNPQAGAASPKMLRMQPNGALTNEFDNAGLLLSPRRMPQHRGAGEQDHGQYDQPALIFGVMGAAALYRRSMLADIAYQRQYFDETYFTWYEDVDLDWRARLLGWDCIYVPTAVAYHVRDPQKNLATPFAARHTIRNRWQMILANECPHCLRRDMHWLLAEELALLRHVIRFRRLRPYVQALSDLIRRLPAVRAKRRWVRSRARHTCLPAYPQPL